MPAEVAAMEYAYLQNLEPLKVTLSGCLNAGLYKVPLHIVQNNEPNLANFPAFNIPKPETPRKPTILPNLCKRELSFDNSNLENNNNAHNTNSPPAKIAKTCKSKKDKSPTSLKYTKPQTVSVVRRNQRERNRVRLINSTFGTLRDHIPQYALPPKQTKKMSKADILKSAIDYINDLQHLITEYDTTGTPQVTQTMMTALTSEYPTTTSPVDTHHYMTSQTNTSDVISTMGSIDSPSSGTLSDCPSPLQDDEIDNEFLDLVSYWLQ